MKKPQAAEVNTVSAKKMSVRPSHLGDEKQPAPEEGGPGRSRPWGNNLYGSGGCQEEPTWTTEYENSYKQTVEYQQFPPRRKGDAAAPWM